MGVYVNADEIQEKLLRKGSIDFAEFKLDVSDEAIKSFFQVSTFSPTKRKEPELWRNVSVAKNIFTISSNVDSYLAADLAEFIRQQLLEGGISFTYETVMSYPGKINFFRQAIQKSFKVYL